MEPEKPGRAKLPSTGRPGGRALVVLVALIVTALLAWDVLGTAGAAVLAGAWVLAAAVGRTVPSLSGPAAWAVGVLAELCLVIGSSAVLALVAPGRHAAAVNAVVLAVPIVVGAGLLARARLRPGGGPAPLPSRWPLALVVTLGGLAGFALLAQLGRHYDVAWAMSGDARNHARIARELLADGGLTVEYLRSSPAGANALTAIIEGAAGRDGTRGALLLDDARGLAVTYVLTAIAMASLLAAAVHESLPRVVRARRRLPLPVGLVPLGAGLAAISPLVLGTTLADGFLSAYVVVVMVLAAVVVGLRISADLSAWVPGIVALVLATGLTFATWPVVVVLPAALLVWALVGGAGALRDDSGRRVAAVVAAVVGVTALVGVGGVLVVSWPSLREAFTFPGSISAPSGSLVPALLLATIALALGSDRARPLVRRPMVVPTVAAVVGVVVVLGLRVLADGPGLVWSYYATKTAWLLACSLVWVPLVPVARWAAAAHGPGGPDGSVSDGAPDGGRPATREAVGIGLAALAGTLAVVLGVGNATSAPEPVLAAARGWGAPNAETVADVVEVADADGSFAFWDRHGAGEDRLANFWAALAWSVDQDGAWVSTPGAEQSFPVWAYFADGSTIASLCDLVEVEDVTVYTRDDDLDLDLEAACPDADPAVVVGD